MELFLKEYPYLAAPIAVAAFLFAIWADFFRIKHRDVAIATFAFGLLPIVGSIFLSPGNSLLFVVMLVALIVYISAFVLMLKKFRARK
jgi:hypothetical protein